MKSTSTFRSFNGSIYVRVLPVYVEHFKLEQQIDTAKKNETKPECKIEDQDQNKLLITFPKW